MRYPKSKTSQINEPITRFDLERWQVAELLPLRDQLQNTKNETGFVGMSFSQIYFHSVLNHALDEPGVQAELLSGYLDTAQACIIGALLNPGEHFISTSLQSIEQATGINLQAEIARLENIAREALRQHAYTEAQND